MAAPETMHYRSPGATNTACGRSHVKVKNTNFTVDVTCRRCRRTPSFQSQHAEFMEVVDSWGSPKEEHPALSKLGHPERRDK